MKIRGKKKKNLCLVILCSIFSMLICGKNIAVSSGKSIEFVYDLDYDKGICKAVFCLDEVIQKEMWGEVFLEQGTDNSAKIELGNAEWPQSMLLQLGEGEGDLVIKFINYYWNDKVIYSINKNELCDLANSERNYQVRTVWDNVDKCVTYFLFEDLADTNLKRIYFNENVLVNIYKRMDKIFLIQVIGSIFITFSIAFILLKIILLLLTRYAGNVSKLYFWLIKDADIKSKYAIMGMMTMLFIGVQIFMLVRFRGCFAFDEFFHIYSINDKADGVIYNRALYINWLERIFVYLFGWNDIVVKCVPVLAGMISFFCLSILSVKLYKRPITIILFLISIIFQPLVLCNHFYIRMYIFIELVLSLSIFVLYYVKKGNFKYRNWLFAIVILLNLGYVKYTNDFSRYMMALLLCVYICYFLTPPNILEKFFSLFRKKKVLFSTVFMVLLGEAIVIAVKCNIGGINESDLRIIKILNDLICNPAYTNGNGILKYFFKYGILILVLFMHSIIIIWKKKDSYWMFLSLVALIPLSIFLLALYDINYLRALAGFIPVIMFLVFYGGENSFKPVLMMAVQIIAVIVFSFVSYPREYADGPFIRYEIGMRDTRTVYDLMEKEMEMGREAVYFLSADYATYYFDIFPDHNCTYTTIRRECNRDEDKIYEYYERAFRELMNSGKKMIVLTDNYSTSMLIQHGLIEEWNIRFSPLSIDGGWVIYYIN